MVDASVLADYEVWSLISSISASAVLGFVVAHLQSNNGGKAFLVNSIIFAVLFAISLGMALWKRDKLRKKAKVIKLRATEIVTREE